MPVMTDPTPEQVLRPGARGTVRVIGGPGTGKSTLLGRRVGHDRHDTRGV